LIGYKLIRADGAGRRGGGSAMYVKSTHKCKILAQSNADAPVNFLFLKIVFRGQKVLVGTFYDPLKIYSTDTVQSWKNCFQNTNINF
jgi:hypothetical protein